MRLYITAERARLVPVYEVRHSDCVGFLLNDDQPEQLASLL